MGSSLKRLNKVILNNELNDMNMETSQEQLIEFLVFKQIVIKYRNHCGQDKSEDYQPMAEKLRYTTNDKLLKYYEN